MAIGVIPGSLEARSVKDGSFVESYSRSASLPLSGSGASVKGSLGDNHFDGSQLIRQSSARASKYKIGGKPFNSQRLSRDSKSRGGKTSSVFAAKGNASGQKAERSIIPVLQPPTKEKAPTWPPSPRIQGPRETDKPAIPPFCPHNGRGDVSGPDILEHIGNGELGSAWRDISEIPSVQEAFQQAVDTAQDALKTLGDELNKGD